MTGRRVVYAGVPWFMRSFQGSKVLTDMLLRRGVVDRCRRGQEMLSSEQAGWVKWKSNNLNGDVGKGFVDNQSHSKDQKDQGEKKYSRG